MALDKHECKWLRLREQAAIELLDGKWVFRYEALADTKTVEDGQAQYVGEVLFSFTLFVNFCPYCGENLIPNLEVSTLALHKRNALSDDWNSDRFYSCQALERYNSEYANLDLSRESRGSWFISKTSRNVWMLLRYTFASPAVMQDGEVQQKDKLRFTYGVDILYCPFCGEPLDIKRINSNVSSR